MSCPRSASTQKVAILGLAACSRRARHHVGGSSASSCANSRRPVLMLTPLRRSLEAPVTQLARIGPLLAALPGRRQVSFHSRSWHRPDASASPAAGVASWNGRWYVVGQATSTAVREKPRASDSSWITTDAKGRPHYAYDIPAGIDVTASAFACWPSQRQPTGPAARPRGSVIPLVRRGTVLNEDEQGTTISMTSI